MGRVVGQAGMGVQRVWRRGGVVRQAGVWEVWRRGGIVGQDNEVLKVWGREKVVGQAGVGIEGLKMGRGRSAVLETGMEGLG